MRILVIGAGVIGITYAWQLSEAGYDVRLFVRKQRMVRYSHAGISIKCIDLRGNKTEFVKTVYRPKTIDRLDPQDAFELVVICLRNFQLKDTVPYIAKFLGNAQVLFLGNMWDEFGLIEKHIPPNRCLFGFPAMAGGGRTDNGINCVLFKNRHTLLGASNVNQDIILLKLADILAKSGMQPKILPNITDWLKIQYICSAATFGAICKAGTVKNFASDYRFIKQSAMASREGFAVARKKHVKAWRLYPFVLFYLPLFIGVSLLKRSYSKELIEVMEGHIKHGFDEMKKHYYDILSDGESFGVNIPVWRSFEPYILKSEEKQ